MDRADIGRASRDAVAIPRPSNANGRPRAPPMARELLERSRRDFSHGCIRLSDPAALARFVLRDQREWTPERIEAAMASGTNRVVPLATPIPVIVFYTTAIVDESGDTRDVRRPSHSPAAPFGRTELHRDQAADATRIKPERTSTEWRRFADNSARGKR